MSLADNLKSRWWRLNHLYYIKDATTGEPIPFRLNRAQRQLLQNLHNRTIILKARQLGFSTLIQILIVDTILFQNSQSCGVIAHKVGAARDLMRNKIKFALKNLPLSLQPERTLDNETIVHLANDSMVQVDTSLRSGTMQILHVSEYGDIALNRPDAALEILTGSLNTLAPSAFGFIESTAKGAGGLFFDLCKQAQDIQASGRKLSSLDWDFRFFPWHEEPRYTLDPDNIVIPIERKEYFAELEGKHGIRLSDGQKAWYHVKATEQGESMGREYPSTPDECFAQSIKGAYFAQEMTLARKQRRITAVPHDPALPVYTAWDLGLDDYTSIWFFQIYGQQYRFVRYEEHQGEGLPALAARMLKLAQEHGWMYAQHLGPHDIEVRDLSTGISRRDTAASLGLEFDVVPRCQDKGLSIEIARQALAKCVFDEGGCSRGLAHLEAYRKRWNERLGQFQSTPMHDEHSHAADAFQEFARGKDLLQHNITHPSAYATPRNARGNVKRLGRNRGASRPTF